MILRKTHIDSVMMLGANGVTLALHNAGYEEDAVKSASFRGMLSSTGSFVYDCTYFDSDTGKDEDCIVYVRFDDKGVMLADY